MIYTINGQQFYTIQEFCAKIQREIPTVRHLLFDGNVVRKMHYIRDRSKIFIPVEEYYGFPHVNSGKQYYGLDIYHYNDKGERVLCKQCTYDTPCEAAKKAEEWHGANEAPESGR